MVDLIGDDDLVLRLLQLDHLAEFGRLAGLAFPNDFGGGLEQADDLAFGVVSPAKTRALVWRITCCTRGTMVSSSRRSRSNRSCRRRFGTCLTPSSISLAKRLACPTTRPVAPSNFWYASASLLRLGWPLARAARAISSIRSLTLRLRSRSLAPAAPAMLVIFFIVRVSTRTPSPNKLLSVG